MDNKYIRLLKNTGIVFVGNAGSKFLTFLMLPFYTRFLSPVQYGITDLLIVYANICVGILTCQMSEAIFLMPFGKNTDLQSRYFSTGLYFLSLMFAVGACVAGAVKSLSGSETFFGQYAWIIFFIFVLTALQGYCQQFSRSADKMIIYATSGLVCVLVTSLASLILIPIYALTGYVFSELLGLAGGFLTVVFAMRLWNYVRMEISLPILKEMLGYSLPIVPVAVMWWLTSSLCRPMVENFCGLAAVGILALSLKAPAFLQAFWRIVDSAWSISVVGECKATDYESFYNKILTLMLWILSSAAIVLTLFRNEVIRIVGGEKYVEASDYMPILAVSSIFYIAAGFVGRTFTAYKVSKYYLYASGGSVVAIILGNVILIPKYGLWGASFSTLVSWLINFILTCYFAQQFTRIVVFSRIVIGCLAVIFIVWLSYWCDVGLFSRVLMSFPFVGMMSLLYMRGTLSFVFRRRGARNG